MGKISPERIQSNAILRKWCASVTGDVLSIGSGGDIDKQGSTYRSYFKNARSYTTSDIDPCMNCDMTLDARNMEWIENDRYDCAFVSGVLEHVDDYRMAISEISRVLKAGGLLLLGVPFKQPIHRAPQDFWRFTEHGLNWVLQDFRFRVDALEPLGDPAFPYGYWAKAVKVG